jgi:hypothetical protein
MKNVSFFVLAVLFSQFSFSQTMTVHKTNQTTVLFQLSQVDSITFSVPPLTDSLVAKYLFSGNARDTSGNGHHGTVNGGATLAVDRFGNPNSAYNFAGTGYISVPNDSGLSLGNRFTIAGWIYVTNSNLTGRLISKGWMPTNQGYEIILQGSNPANIRLDIATGGVTHLGNSWDTTLTTNSWHQVAVTYDGTRLQFYFDGTITNEIAMTGTVTSNTYPINIGRNTRSTGDFFFGRIDDILIYSRPLSIAEIQTLYHQGGW